jgi:acyl-CoA synthetase (AMP-forming)/AMP-acid ligase II
MTTTLLLEMMTSADASRAAVGPRASASSYQGLLETSRTVAAGLTARGVRTLGVLGLNGPHLPSLIFGAGAAGVPFAPLNYRLTDEQLAGALERLAPLTVVADQDMAHRVSGLPDVDVISYEALLAEPQTDPPGFVDPDSIAVILLTSGTSGPPKAAVLRHQHLMTYIVQTVELASARSDEAILISVPPYHIAAISSVLSSVYAGRRIISLAAFAPEQWVDLALAEGVTHAMVVPTMLGRILDDIEARGVHLPALRHLSYGGGRMPIATVERALALLPGVDFVNAYGLTETSSTIALLGPDDHRTAFASDEPSDRARLGSVGRPLPSIELQIRDRDGHVVGAGVTGEIWVRGEQVSGEYLTHRATDAEGWYPTRDVGRLDTGGYLFLDGRADDVIVRGGENIAPGEIEDVLVEHPAVAEAAVVGLPDLEWGERIEAFVVPVIGQHPSEVDLREWVRTRLRSTRTPERIHFRDVLPSSDTGKLLRRELRVELTSDGVAE